MRIILYILLLLTFPLTAQVFVNGNKADLFYNGNRLARNAIKLGNQQPSIPNKTLSTLKAFPTAYGGGSNVTGGRGGNVYKVTNLNTTGTGSFYQAVLNADAAGGGYIVPDVSGVINLPTGGWSFTDIDNVTILGQLAPQGGLNFTGGRIRFTYASMSNPSSNLIFRHITSRPIKDRNGNLDPSWDDAYTAALQVAAPDGVIIDHCSFSTGNDKVLNLDAGDSNDTFRDVTVSHTLIADGATMLQGAANSGILDNTPSMGNWSVIYNVLGRGTNRAPNAANNGYFEIMNNVIHAGTSRLTRTYFNTDLNMYRNYYINHADPVLIEHQFQNVGTGTPSIYVAENFYTGILTGSPTEDNSVIWREDDGSTQLGASYFTSTMHTRTVPNPSPILTLTEAYTMLVTNKDVGHNRYVDDNGISQIYQDTYDLEIINEVENEIRTTPKLAVNWVMPTIPVNNRPAGWDDDVTGIPDVFSTAHGITSASQIITNWDFGTYTVTNTAGYPAIEIYAAYAAGDLDKLPND